MEQQDDNEENSRILEFIEFAKKRKGPKIHELLQELQDPEQVEEFDVYCARQEHQWEKRQPGCGDDIYNYLQQIKRIKKTEQLKLQLNESEQLKRKLPNLKEILGNESEGDRKRRKHISETVVKSHGSDFIFSDREQSFEILANCLENRFYCRIFNITDKLSHPLPFLADGPGSGKSRFLQELPYSFKFFVENLKTSVSEKPNFTPLDEVASFSKSTPTHFADFKNTLSSALFINVSFGNGSMYTTDEQAKINIQESLCLRILYPYYSKKYSNFSSFFDAFMNKQERLPSLTLNSTLNLISEKDQIIVLGVDEVNVLHFTSKELFKGLFLILGSCSCSYSPLFAPVVAGTVIGPMKSVVSESVYPPLHIPLPLLSFDSCLRILVTKDAKYQNGLATNTNLKQVVWAMGGHCRAMEILYKTLSESRNRFHPDYWDDVLSDVRRGISILYPMCDLVELGNIIAYSYLSIGVKENQKVLDSELSFLNFEELGLVKLDRLKDGSVKVKVPFIFVICFLKSSTETEYSKFWTQILITKKMYWQNWEEFNCMYTAFRLSLYSKLRFRSISLSEFLSGAKMNMSVIKIDIPSINEIKVEKIGYQYPKTVKEEFNVGVCVLNGYSAPFDAFVYLATSAGRLLLAQQSKLAYDDSKKPQKVTDKLINDEFNKTQKCIEKISNPDFALLILGRCQGDYDDKTLPVNCAVVSRDEIRGFYGDEYNQSVNQSE